MSGGLGQANFRKWTISKATKTTQGIKESREKMMPMVPAEDGMIIKNPEANPHSPIDPLN